MFLGLEMFFSAKMGARCFLVFCDSGLVDSGSMVGIHLRWDPLGTWVPCSPSGGKGKKGGGKGKDCRAPQDDDCAEHEKSGDLLRAP